MTVAILVVIQSRTGFVRCLEPTTTLATTKLTLPGHGRAEENSGEAIEYLILALYTPLHPLYVGCWAGMQVRDWSFA